MQNVRLQNYLHFHVIVFIYGFTAILGELITIDALALVWYRMLLATIFVAVYALIAGISLRVSKKSLLTLSIAGAVIAVHWVTFFAAIKVSNIAITLSVLSTGAFFTAILEPIFYKRKLLWYELVFGVLVIYGLYIIFNVAAGYTTGILLALLSALFSTIFTLINGKIATRYRPTTISFYELGIGVLLLSLYLVVQAVFFEDEGRFLVSFFSVQTMDWLYLAALASICTAYAFIASVQVMRYLSPYTIMLTINLEPIYGIVLAFFIFGNQEQMAIEFYFGALLIITTVIGNGIFKMTRKRKIGTS